MRHLGFAIVAVALGAGGCAGKGVSFEEVQAPLENTCARCHDAAGIDGLLADIRAADDAAFTAEAFPDAQFPDGLRVKTVQDLITTADPPDDATLDPMMPQRKAWILHELHELKALLAEATPPDYTTQAKFDAFATLGEPGAYEGCEIGDKLDLGYALDPEGMNPLWAEKLMEILDRQLAPLSDEDRQRIRDYVDGLLPGGLRSCGGGSGGSAS